MSSVLLPEGRGIFEGYASLFGLPDMARDVVIPGAFQKSLAAQNASNIKLLWQHDPAQPVGIWKRVSEDTRGLYCQGQLNLDVQRGRELYALMRQGAVDGLSIGFKTTRSRKDALGQRQLLTIDLWEISLVTFPLLPEARISAVKTLRSVPFVSPASDALIERARKIFNPSNQ
jgi:HK97 family phage prohead protease